MQKYSDYQPTQFDRKGAFLEDDRQSWEVVPVIQTRDSETLERSNFEVALQWLGGESETVEVHRFGHWGPGWFEIIIVDPKSPQYNIAEEIEAALAYYPVLDDMHFSELEYNEAREEWEGMPIKERIEQCRRARVSIFAARRDSLPETPTGEYITQIW